MTDTDLLRNTIREALREYRARYTVDIDGNGLPLADLLTPSDEHSISRGLRELVLLADHLAVAVGGLEGTREEAEGLR